MKHFFLFFFSLFFISETTFSRVKLPALINSGMVLQQNSSVKLWGWAEPLKKLTITSSWDRKEYKIEADAAGNWMQTVVTPKAGGPHQITFDDGEITKIENILMGEVWVCSGQSNMAMRLRGGMNQPVSNFHEILLDANNDQIRVFTVANAMAAEVQNDVKGTWKVSNPQNALDFSAVGLVYAQNLQKYLNVPIGLIVSSWGGTPIQAWMSEESLKEIPGSYLEPSEKPNQNDPMVLYNAMIMPLTQYGIRGFLWYQGESNRNKSEIYERQMQGLVKTWRQAWNRGNLPFYYVQIAPWLYPSDKEGIAALLREQQFKASRSIPNVGMAVTLDIGSDQTIHPPNKLEVGNRLAYHALANTYSIQGIPARGPEFKELTVNGDQAQITFYHSELGLVLKNKTSENFEIAGADKVFHQAEAKINGKGLIIKSDKVSKPVAVRYAFKNYVEGDLYNTFGLPASSFRTDDWEIN